MPLGRPRLTQGSPNTQRKRDHARERKTRSRLANKRKNRVGAPLTADGSPNTQRKRDQERERKAAYRNRMTDNKQASAETPLDALMRSQQLVADALGTALGTGHQKVVKAYEDHAAHELEREKSKTQLTLVKQHAEQRIDLLSTAKKAGISKEERLALLKNHDEIGNLVASAGTSYRTPLARLTNTRTESVVSNQGSQRNVSPRNLLVSVEEQGQDEEDYGRIPCGGSPFDCLSPGHRGPSTMDTRPSPGLEHGTTPEASTPRANPGSARPSPGLEHGTTPEASTPRANPGSARPSPGLEHGTTPEASTPRANPGSTRPSPGLEHGTTPEASTPRANPGSARPSPGLELGTTRLASTPRANPGSARGWELGTTPEASTPRANPGSRSPGVVEALIEQSPSIAIHVTIANRVSLGVGSNHSDARVASGLPISVDNLVASYDFSTLEEPDVGATIVFWHSSKGLAVTITPPEFFVPFDAPEDFAIFNDVCPQARQAHMKNFLKAAQEYHVLDSMKDSILKWLHEQVWTDDKPDLPYSYWGLFGASVKEARLEWLHKKLGDPVMGFEPFVDE